MFGKKNHTAHKELQMHGYTNYGWENRFGETVLLKAMSFAKPVIITRPSCLADDYVEDGVTGLIIDKNGTNCWGTARIFEDEAFCQKLSSMPDGDFWKSTPLQLRDQCGNGAHREGLLMKGQR
jgi:glycosyltransferase involved in cell wall biosynthesis